MISTLGRSILRALGIFTGAYSALLRYVVGPFGPQVFEGSILQVLIAFVCNLLRGIFGTP